MKCIGVYSRESLSVAKSKTKKKKGQQSRWQDNAVVRYLRDTRAELRKVHWPTRQEAESLTKVVLLVTVSMAIFLGTLDYLFALELRGLVDRSALAVGAAVVVAVASGVVIVILNRQGI